MLPLVGFSLFFGFALSRIVGERKLRMRQINLTQVALCLEAKHCPPLDSAEQVLAEAILRGL